MGNNAGYTNVGSAISTHNTILAIDFNPIPIPAAPVVSAVSDYLMRNVLTLVSSGTGYDKYTLQRSIFGTNSWSVISKTLTDSDFTYNDTDGLVQSTHYAYRIRSVNGGGVSDWYTFDVTTKSPQSIP